MKKLYALTLLFTLFAASAAAQTRTPAERLLFRARAFVDSLTGDSAFVLANAALQANPTQREKVRAYVLMAIGESIKENRSEVTVQQAFTAALRLDPTEKVDSLAELGVDIPRLFARAREAIGPVGVNEAATYRAPLQLDVLLSLDTAVSPSDARYVFSVGSNHRSTIVTRVSHMDAPGVPIWADSQPTTGRRTVAWPLSDAEGVLVAPGRYLFRSQAIDSTGQATPIFERTFRLTRAAPDTQVPPPPLPASAFAPETLAVAKNRPPRVLFSGVSIAALIAITPVALGNSTLNAGLSGDPTAYAVAGSVAVASIFGFVKGRTPAKLSAENIQRNQLLRENDRRQRESVEQNNARARAQTPMRVTVEGGGAP